jgi:hypothetical protein
MVVTGILAPFFTVPSIAKPYFTKSQHASGLSLTAWSINLCLRKLAVDCVRTITLDCGVDMKAKQR